MNQHIARRLPSPLIRALIAARSLALWLLEPVDRMGLLVTGKSMLPPLRLRRFVGPVGRFEASGAEWACMLKLMAGLKSGSTIWDIGCGCGVMAMELKPYLLSAQGARYVGSDIHKPSIMWCQHHIREPHYQFIYHDLYNASYNQHGTITPANFDPGDGLGLFDVVMAKSLFTHINPDMAARYLSVISDHLAADGKCLLSCFLFDSAQTSKGEIDFAYGDDHFRYAYQNRMEAAVAYQHDYFIDMLNTAGLHLAQPILRGGWFQRIDALNYQDIVMLEHHHVP
jgi:2-polyprenyl-3-methyl-5-hydroxy-6-metoxy-1,4-benzoquinol methylase